MNPASNLVLVGPMGAGKSSIGRRLAARFGLPFADVDREIEAQTGTTIATIFECEGETGFRARERAVLSGLLAGSGVVIATGGGAVLDPGTRTLLAQRGFVVYLQVGLEQQVQRLARDRSRPLLAGGDRREVLERLARERAPLYAAVADLAFDTGNDASLDAAIRLGHRLDGCWHRARAEHPA